MYQGPKRLDLRFSRPKLKELPKTFSNDDTVPVLAVDPGGVTGWSLFVLKDKSLLEGNNQEALIHGKYKWWHGEIDCRIDQSYGVYQLLRILDTWPRAAVVFEDFNVRQLAVDLSPVAITAKFEYHLWRTGQRRILFKQSASQAKTTARDDRLKLWSIYTREGGLGHARDADRHVILFLRRCLGHKGSQLRSEAWPSVFG